MTRRYWLALLCVALALGVPSEAYNSRLYSHRPRASSGSVWEQLGWPSLPDFRRPVYPRPYHSLSSRPSYQRSFPAAGETSYYHARRPAAARPAPAPFRSHHVHHTQADQHRAASPWIPSSRQQPTHTADRAYQPSHTVERPHQPSHTVERPHQPSHTVERPQHNVGRAHQRTHTVDRPQRPSHTVNRPQRPSHTVDRAQRPSHTVDSAAARPAPAPNSQSRVAALPANTEGRQGKQWTLPRRFMVSTDSERGSVQVCQNGKVWHNGKCQCPYLSNWNEATSTCECVYGTYRHSSGHCRTY